MSSEQRTSTSNVGLDARLDRAVPAENAVGFLLAGDGTQPGRVYPLTRNTSVIGRAESADVRISQPAVSGEHARIVCTSTGFEVEDLGSINGTYVNGTRVTRSRLSRGDRLSLGNVEFTFLMEKTADATMALMPPGARRSGTSLVAARPVGMASPYYAGDEPDMTLADFIQRTVSTYHLLRPHFPLALRLMLVGAFVGAISAVALPPPNTAICEARLDSGKKANPIDDDSVAKDDAPLQFFVDPDRSFVLPGLVVDTLEKLAASRAADPKAVASPGTPAAAPPVALAGLEALVAKVQPRLRLEQFGEKLFRAVYVEPIFGGGEPPPVEFLDLHVRNYIDTDIARGLKMIDKETKFLNDKLSGAVADLTRINNELAEFKKQNADDLPEQSEQAHSSRFYLDTRRGELTAQVAKMAGELAVDEALMKEGNPLAQSKFQASQVYRTSLQDLRRRMSEAYGRGLADGHPEIVQMKSEMARLQKVLEQEMTSETSVVDQVADPAYAGLRAKVAVQRAQLRAAKMELADVERNAAKAKLAVTAIPAVAAKLDDLQRQYDAKKRLHDQLSAQAQKAMLQLEVERLAAQSRFEIVTPAYSTRPSLKQTLMLRLALGLGVGLGLALLLVLYHEGRKFLLRSMASLPARG